MWLEKKNREEIEDKPNNYNNNSNNNKEVIKQFKKITGGGHK